MIVTHDAKTTSLFTKVDSIVTTCFHGIERPPITVLEENFRTGIVFANGILNQLRGIAILTERGARDAFLWIMAVVPESRNMGIGSSLLKEIEEYAKGRYARIGLTCKTDNPVQKLYFDYGYRVTKVLRDFYAPEGDGLFMGREL